MKLFKARAKNNLVDIFNITEGTIIPLSEVKDEVFSKEMLGKGVGIIPSDNNSIYSPVSGEVCTVFPTKHAIGIKTVEGAEILIHIGIDTVNLNGEHFDCFVEQGQHIIKDKLLDVNS
ncbi:PTS glucose transporter subunit IIA [Breznakia sp. OttesenSCG-928-G09]|nr:PTS glucose transporter subunit IIA [Breznakia sp. OttesenSCG-928-G09]